ncbi:MAG TPA: peptidoglycan-binding domain-containing protein [Chthoniobacter sp.]|nr:peptidoglycan-binding domain-containing protein [Chthoniobacter sp.]
MNRPVIFLILASSAAVLYANDEVRSTQEELRRRNIYFGDIDGRPSPELEQALKHYQKRKGLSATGQDDHDTLRSLGVVARSPGDPLPKEVQLPEEPVLKSDTRIDIVGEAHEIASSTGVSVASVAPDEVASGKSRRSKRDASAYRPAAAAANVAPKIKGSAPTVTGSSLKAPEVLADYVNRYLHAVSHNDLEDELHFYADRVDYLGNGWVDRRIIEHSLSKYYARWPHRRYSHVEAFNSRAIPSAGVIVVKYRVGFILGNGKSKARGETDNEIVINAATADPRIISIKETRVRH